MNTHDAVGVQITELIDSGLDAPVIEDHDFVAEFEEARSGHALASSLSSRPTPAGFARRVQTRVRRRSGGRYFHPASRPFGYVVSVEAFVILAVATMAACWLMLDSRSEASAPALYLDPPVVEQLKPAP